MTRNILLSILFIILTCNANINAYRILAVSPLQSKSHWGIMEQLLKGLVARGHQVDVITHFPLKESIANYTEINVSGVLPQLTNSINATLSQNFNNFFSISTIVPMLGSSNCELLGHPKIQDIIKNSHNPSYDIAIISIFISPCYMAFGRYLKIPVIGLITSSMYDWINEISGNSVNPAYVPSYYSAYDQYMNFQERLLNFFMINMHTILMNYYSNLQLQYVKKYFDLDISSINDLYLDIALYLVNTHYTLNDVRPLSPNVIEVSGLHIKDDDAPIPPEMKKWLDESEHGCIFFTFGSMVRIETFPEETITQIYASFEKIAPVRVLMKIAKKEDLIPGLPKNVMTYPWFPQISILKHKNTRAFITHGGLMGIVEAIYSAVPMIGIPLFGDQFRNVRNCHNKKIAISLNSIDDITEEKLTLALNNILNNSSYRENMQKMSQLFFDRPMSPLNTSIYWVEYIAKYGYVLQSPVLQIHWLQQKLLDVYAFLFAVIIAIYYVARFILRKLKNYLFQSHTCANRNHAAVNSKKNK